MTMTFLTIILMIKLIYIPKLNTKTPFAKEAAKVVNKKNVLYFYHGLIIYPFLVVLLRPIDRCVNYFK